MKYFDDVLFMKKRKPDIELLKSWIHVVIKLSGENSVRVLLMSATL
jgi:hypothetical protein